MKTQTDNNEPKVLLARGLTNVEGILPVAITVQIRQSGRTLRSNPDSCEIIRNLTSGFWEEDFFKNFFMSV